MLLLSLLQYHLAISETQAEDHFVAALTPKQPILELLNLEGGYLKMQIKSFGFLQKMS